MNPSQFIQKYYIVASEIEKETGIPSLAILAQAAIESGWGKYAIGNNLFGIKYTKKDHAYRKVLTTEYSKSPNDFKGSDILSVKFDQSSGKYKYKIYQYFADYKTIKDGFLGHARLLLSERYRHALKYNDPLKYLESVWKAGYATDPNYIKKMEGVINSIRRRL